MIYWLGLDAQYPFVRYDQLQCAFMGTSLSLINLSMLLIVPGIFDF